ncbi:MAG: UvrD-helicase domain-containing protein [Bryobacteraceae bacterium]|jgi:ATP-dependent exoDNAse (exonuclease V) beta subunit
MKDVTLTPDQLKAVDVAERHVDACVVAGPGSGKTTVLVEYFKRLVEAGVEPLRILAITFTEKAASNMRKKLAEAFEDAPDIRGKLERAWVSTVHGFCARLLRENAVFAGIDPEFYVSDERESWRMQQESVAAAIDALFQEHPAPLRALIRGLSSSEFEREVLSAYDTMRGAGVGVEKLSGFAVPQDDTAGKIAATRDALRNDPLTGWSQAQRQYLESILETAERIAAAAGPLEKLQAIEGFSADLRKCRRGTAACELVRKLRDEQIQEMKCSPITEFYAPQHEFLIEILRRFDRLYRERKRQAGALDFADLEEYTVRLLTEQPDTRARLQSQFEHILMDEFQDTNGQQSELLKKIRPLDRFYAVGDINQSIFGFRHADPKGFSEYQKEIESSGKRLHKLVENFRSRAEILSAVETIVNGVPGIEPRSLVARREFDKPRPVCVDVLVATELEMEAQWVARRILELLEAGPEFGFKDVAVLVRNTEVMAAFAAAFERAGIPYLLNRGKGFYETREVNDLTHLLRVIANPRDEISLAAVLRSPLVAASDESLLRLRVMGDDIGASLMRLSPETRAELDAEDYRRLVRFRDRLREWRIRREYVSFDRLLLSAIDDCGYRGESGARGPANIDKFLAQAREAAGRVSLDEFVEELALVRASNPREPDAPPEDSANAVKVMTVHSAKGLEFPIVFVAALHKGVETKLPVVTFSPRIGLGARWRNPAVRKDEEDLFQREIRKERAERESRESHRLLYVAMTRAEQHLVLSFSRKQIKEWADLVVKKLDFDPKLCRDEVLTRTAPDGQEWKLRLLVTDRAPELPVGQALRPVESENNVELVSRPKVAEQQDTNATVTALTAFANCPRAYYLGHYLGFEGRPRKLAEAEEEGGLSAGELGTQVHALLAGSPVPKADVEALHLAEVFRQSPLGRRAARASRVEREFDFLMAVEDLVIRGQVDLWFEEGGEVVLVDYKTDSVTAREAHERARDYALQVQLYALAVERFAGRAPDRAWLHFLRPNTVVEVDLTPSLLERPDQIVRDFQDAQSNLEFPLNEGERCRRCPFFRDLCPAMYDTHREAHASLC